jgi:hypothetical protein
VGAGVTQAPGASDACSLLRKAEAQAAVGAKILDPEPRGEMPGKATFCEFNSLGFPALQVIRVSPFTGSEAEMKEFFEPGSGVTKIPGLGQDARIGQNLVGT